MSYRHDSDALTVMDWFAGAGGSSQGAHAVPGVRVERAANHWARALESHAANFPEADHYQGDIRKAPVWDWPVTDIFWASPECTSWSVAKGKRRDFTEAMQGDLFSLLSHEDDDEPTPEEESRALMEEVPLYLRGVQERGGLVKAGVVENVVDVRAWTDWDRWLGELHKLGYRTRVIALNSMHANPRTVYAAPQSRDRLYVSYWHESLGRTPDWDKWLRPRAVCETCGPVQAVQWWKRAGVDMGRYRAQYVYRCPNAACRNAVVEPEALPALAAIDWSIPGQRIGDRVKPLADKTLKRIEAGLKRRFASTAPMMAPAGGTRRNDATSVLEPMPARITRENDAPVIPPLRSAAPDAPAFVMRNNGSKGAGGEHCTPAAEPFRTITTAGHQSLVTWEHLLVPYYGNSTARSVTEPIGALTTRDRYALVHTQPAIEDVRFRMLEPHEIGRAMSFADEYTVLGNKRERVRQYGNAVTPNAAEVLLCALVEAITGSELERTETPETHGLEVDA